MIAEEDPFFLRRYFAFSMLTGFHIMVGTNFREAIDCFITLRPQIVVLGKCSSNSRRMNFANELIQIEPTCKIILLEPEPEQLDAAEKIGFDLILSTKISNQRFLDCVRGIIRTKNFTQLALR